MVFCYSSPSKLLQPITMRNHSAKVMVIKSYFPLVKGTRILWEINQFQVRAEKVKDRLDIKDLIKLVITERENCQNLPMSC